MAEGRWSDVVALGFGAVEPLIEAAKADRPEAIQALGQIGDRRALDPLVSILGGWLGSRPKLDPATLAAGRALGMIDPGWVDSPEARGRVRSLATQLKNRESQPLAMGPLLTFGIATRVARRGFL
jgi:hypothetical protein